MTLAGTIAVIPTARDGERYGKTSTLRQPSGQGVKVLVRPAQRRNGLVFAAIVMPRPVYVIQRRLACAVCTGSNVTRVPLTIASRVRHMYAP